MLCNKRGHDSERPAHRDEECPRLPQLEKALAQIQHTNQSINQSKKKKVNALPTDIMGHFEKGIKFREKVYIPNMGGGELEVWQKRR